MRYKILIKYTNFSFKKFNIENFESFKVLKKYQFDHIFHFAAQAGVRYSVVKPKNILIQIY